MQPQHALDLLGAAHQAAHRTPVGVQDGLGVDAGGTAEGEGDAVAAQQFGDGDAHLHPFLGALVPGHEDPVGQVQFGDLREAAAVRGPLDRTPLRVQEAQLQGEGRRAPRFHEDLGLLEDVLLVRAAPGRGHEDTELPAQPVLRGRGPVRVEHVPLQQDRVGHLSGDREAEWGVVVVVTEPPSR